MSFDLHALAGAYAVDALDDVERARFERHLRECEDCRAEVASLHEATGLLAESVMATPPPSLRERVLAEAATVRPLPPVMAESAQTAPTPITRRRPRRLPTLAAAAAAVVAIGAGGVVWQPWGDDGSSQSPRLTASERVLNAKDAESYTKTFPGGARATITVSDQLNQAVIQTKDMPAAQKGTVYQVWLQHDDVMVDAGLMPEGPDNTVLLYGDPADAVGAGITVEPAGGSQTPSDEVVALFEFQQT